MYRQCSLGLFGRRWLRLYCLPAIFYFFLPGQKSGLAQGALALESPALTFEVEPQVGGRISSLRYRGVELLATRRDERNLQWGSTVWPAPQSAWRWPPPAGMDQRLYAVIAATPDLILIESEPNAYQGLQLAKRFELLDDNSIGVTYTFINQGDSTVKAGIWENTRVEYEGEVQWPAGERLEEGITGLVQEAGISTLALKGHEQKKKLFINTEGGWLSLRKQGAILKRMFSRVGPAQVAPGQAPVEIYFDPVAGFAELEIQGPYVELEPGKTTSFYILWAVEGEEIRPSNTHPQYWFYKGTNTLLLGGSVEDNLFQVPELEAHLGLLQSVGGNYVRNTMSSRDSGNVWPFYFEEEKGLYDLEHWNDEYWRRFETFLQLTGERGIIVQIEVWATFDFYRDNWNVNPFNPKNNSNYTAERAKLPEEVTTHPTWTENPFFWSIPLQQNNIPVLQYQQKFVDKLLSYSLRHGHVLYCIDNETSVTAAWGCFWADYIRKKAREQGKQVYITEMWDPHDLGHITHRETFDHPDIYDFVEISQNNHQRGQAHWDNGLAQVERLRRLGNLRPVNNVKVYGSDEGRHGGGTQNGIQSFIRNVFFGSAAVRFHRPNSGLGLGPEAQAVIRSMRQLTDRMDFFNARPHNDLLAFP